MFCKDFQTNNIKQKKTNRTDFELQKAIESCLLLFFVVFHDSQLTKQKTYRTGLFL